MIGPISLIVAELLDVGRQQRVDRAEVLGQHGRHPRADVADRQRVEQPRQPALLAGLDAAPAGSRPTSRPSAPGSIELFERQADRGRRSRCTSPSPTS